MAIDTTRPPRPDPGGSLPRSVQDPKHKRTTYGTGLLKGLQITLRHLFSRAVTVQYPDERPALPPRTRGVIALKEENCTVCMLCARECPDWCIYIDGHKEERQPAQPGKRAKKYNVLDRFAIDYALCMFCGICVEVCPYDALFWSPEFEYAEHDITLMTHEKEKLSDWMYTVLPPPPLDDGARGPEFKMAATSAPQSTSAAIPPSAAAVEGQARTSEGEDEGSTTVEALREHGAEEVSPRTEPEPDTAALLSESKGTPSAAPEPGAPAAAPEPGAPAAASKEEAAEIRRRVYEEEIAKGSDPRVAEGRAKAAEVRALKGTKGPG